MMVLNRLCDPERNLGVLRWLEEVPMPELAAEHLKHDRLLRAMDALIDHRQSVEHAVAVGRSAAGLPIVHELVEGNVAETKTLTPMSERLLERFRLRRDVVVADRGLLS